MTVEATTINKSLEYLEGRVENPRRYFADSWVIHHVFGKAANIAAKHNFQMETLMVWELSSEGENNQAQRRLADLRDIFYKYESTTGANLDAFSLQAEVVTSTSNQPTSAPHIVHSFGYPPFIDPAIRQEAWNTLLPGGIWMEQLKLPLNKVGNEIIQKRIEYLNVKRESLKLNFPKRDDVIAIIDKHIATLTGYRGSIIRVLQKRDNGMVLISILPGPGFGDPTSGLTLPKLLTVFEREQELHLINQSLRDYPIEPLQQLSLETLPLVYGDRGKPIPNEKLQTFREDEKDQILYYRQNEDLPKIQSDTLVKELKRAPLWLLAGMEERLLRVAKFS